MTPDEAYGAVLASVRDHVGMAYAVAIPSYRRTERLVRGTLPTLDRLAVDRDRVTVFCADDAEAEQYRAALPDWRVVVARPGLHACRQWYANAYYPPGTPVLSMDDDIDDVVAAVEGRLRPWPGTLDQLATMGFGACAAIGSGLWGITDYTNGLYLRDEMAAGLRRCVGNVFGSYAGDQITIPIEAPVANTTGDMVRTLRAYTAFGGVVRLEWLSISTTYHAEGGKLAELGGRAQRDRHQDSQVRALALSYPHLAQITVDKTGFRNVRLRSHAWLRVPRASMERAATRQT